MAKKNLEDTQHIKTIAPEIQKASDDSLNDTQSIKTQSKRWKFILLGILLVILFAAGGSGLGYYQGIQQRLAFENEEVLTQAALHYQYGIQAIEAGNYDLARTQLEYVLQIYPSFPGLTEKYTEVMVKLAGESGITSPALEPTPTIDNQGAEALFAQAVQAEQSQQWALAMQTLEALRNEDYTYRTIEVDGMYFTALRYRAVELIVTEGNLEEGLYFLALLEKYAPLDHDAVNYAVWARLYLTGASFWDLDWSQVVNYFGQLTGAFPYMHDGTGWTATDRYVKGSEYYGDQLAGEGKHCEAIKQYQNVLNYSALEYIQDKYNISYIKCYPPTPTPGPTATESVETPTEEPPAVPTDTPTVEPPPEDPPEGGEGSE